MSILNLYEPFRRYGSTDMCSKVTPVKSIYLLNVVVKQADRNADLEFG